MKRRAFSIIELIFVIIILGILSSVVIIKLGSMTKRAKEAQLKSFVGTLERSVGPALWFRSIKDDREGSVAFADYEADLSNYVELVPDYTSGPSLTNCNNTGNGIFLTYVFRDTYEIHCMDGNATTSPKFRLYDQTESQYLE